MLTRLAILAAVVVLALISLTFVSTVGSSVAPLATEFEVRSRESNGLSVYTVRHLASGACFVAVGMRSNYPSLGLAEAPKDLCQ